MNPYFFESCMKRAGVKRSDVKKFGDLQILFSWFVRVVLNLEIDLLSTYNPPWRHPLRICIAQWTTVVDETIEVLKGCQAVLLKLLCRMDRVNFAIAIIAHLTSLTATYHNCSFNV